MSRPPYNPCASGNSNSTQRQYGFSSDHKGKDPQVPSLHHEPGSSFTSSSGIRPSLMPHTLGYSPEGVRTEMDQDIGRTVDLHIDSARDDVRGLNKPMQHNTGHGSGFTSKPRDDYCSSDTGSTYSSSSTGRRHSDLQSGRSSLDWSSKYDKLSSDCSKSFSSSASSSHGQRDLQYIPGLADFGKSSPLSETVQSEHTTETALNILRQHGLEKEDLEHLISYPEDQMTPTNLPYILRQIRIHKAERTTAAGQPKPFPDHQPTARASGMCSQRSSIPGISAPSQKGMSSAGLQPRKVIDYGHTSKFPGGVVDEAKSTIATGSSAAALLRDTSNKSRRSHEQLCKDTTKTKPPSSGTSVDPTGEKSQRKSEGLKTNSQTLLKVQPPSCTSLHGVHPDRPGLVLIQRNDNSGNHDKSKMKNQESLLADQTKKHQMQRQPVQQQSKQQTQKKAASNMEQGAWPPVFSAAKPRLSAAPIPSITSVSKTLPHATFSPSPISHPPTTHQLPPAPVNFKNKILPNSQGKMSATKGLPSPALISDYTATTPRFFPHTCSLCVKDCFQLQDWISHQNTSLHLENCKLLRRNYPDWNGEDTHEARDECIYVKPTSKHRLQKGVRGSHSPSSSPHLSEGRREKNSRSRSPVPSSKYIRRSPKKEDSPSRKGDRHSPQRRNDARRSPQRRSREERSPLRRPDSRRSPPKRLDDRASPPRWHDKRRSPVKRGQDRRSPPRRLSERRSPPKRPEKRRLSPRKGDSRWSPKRNNESQLLQKKAESSKSKQPDLDVMVKNLANALMAEISKMKSSSSKGTVPSSGGKKASSSASSSSLKIKASSSKGAGPLAGGKKASSTVSSCSAKKSTLKSSLDKNGASSTIKTKCAKSSPPTMVRLLRVQSTLSRNDVVSALERYGKIKSFLMFRSKQEAMVCFEKAEDAKTLISIKTVDVKGVKVQAVRKMDAKQKMSSQITSDTFNATSASKLQASKSLTSPRKAPLKTQLKGISSSGIALKTAVRVVVKGGKKNSIVGSKPQKISSKQVTKNVKVGKQPLKGPIKKVRKRPLAHRSKTPENQDDVAHFDQKPMPAICETITDESMILVKETVACESEKTMDGIEVDCAEEDESTAAKNAVCTHLEDHRDDEDCTIIEDVSIQPVVQNFEACTTMDLLKTSKSTTSEDPPDDNNFETVEDTPIKDIFIYSKLTSPEDKPDGDEPNVERSLAESTALGHQPTTENSVNVEDVDAKDKRSVSKSTSSEDLPESAVKEAMVVVVPLVQTESGEPENLSNLEPKNDTNLERASELLALNNEQMIAGQSGFDNGKLVEVKSDMEVVEDLKSFEVLQEHHDHELSCKADESCPTEASEHIHHTSLSELESTLKTPETKTGHPHGQLVGAEKTMLLGEVEKKETVLEVTEEKMQKSSYSGKGSSDTKPRLSWPNFPYGTKPTIGEIADRRLDPSKIVCLSKETYTSSQFLERGSKVLLITKLPRHNDDSYTEKDLADLLIPFGFKYTNENIYIVPQRQMGFVEMPDVESLLALMKSFRNEGIFFKQSKLCFGVVASAVSVTALGIYTFLMRLMKKPVAKEDRVIFLKNISQSKAAELAVVWKQNSNIANYFPLLNKVFIEFWTSVDTDRFIVWYNLLKKDPGYEIFRLKPPKTYKLLSPRVSLERKDEVEGIKIPQIHSFIPRGFNAPFWITTKTSPFLFSTSFPWFSIPSHLTVTDINDIREAGHRGSKFSTVMLTGLPETMYRHESIARLAWPYLPKQNLQSLYYNVIVLPLQRRAFLFFADWASCCNFVREHLSYPFSLNGCSLTLHFVLQNIHPEYNEEMLYKSMIKWSQVAPFQEIQEPDTLGERLLCVETSETSVETVRMVVEVVSSFAPFVSFLPLANRICIEMADSAGLTKVLENYETFSPDSFEKGVLWSNVQRFETAQKTKQRLQETADSLLNLDLNADDALRQSYNKDFLKTITRTVYRDENKSEEEMEVSSSKNHSISRLTPQSSPTVAKDDFTADTLSSDVYLFDDLNLNMEDFVTVDEVWDDTEDITPRSHRRSSSTHRERGVRQSSYMSSSRQTSSRSSKGSLSSNYAAKSLKESSSELPTKSRTSSKSSKPSSSSPSLSAVNITSTGQRKQVKRSESLPKPSDAGDDLSTCLFSAATENKRAESEVLKSDPTEAQEDVTAKTAINSTFVKQMDCNEEGNKGEKNLDIVNKKVPDFQDKSQEGRSGTQQTVPEENMQVAGCIVETGDKTAEDKEVAVEEEENGSSAMQLSENVKSQIPEDAGGVDSLATPNTEITKDIKDLKILREDQPSQDLDRNCNSVYPDENSPDEEKFEVLDSIDDQTVAEEDLKMWSQLSEHVSCKKEDTYQVIDSVEDQSMTTVVKVENDYLEMSSTKAELPSRSDSEATEFKEEEMETKPKRCEETPPKYKTRKKMETIPKGIVQGKCKEIGGKMASDIVDSVEDDTAQVSATPERASRRRSAQEKKEDKATLSSETTAKDEESSFHVLDSVEETVEDEPAVGRRVTRGQRNRQSNKETLTETTRKESAPLKRRITPSREESTPTKKSDSAAAEEDKESLDSPVEPVVQDVRTNTGRRRGRPAKGAKTGKKASGPTKDDDKETPAPSAEGEGEVTYQILDSVEEENLDVQVAGPPDRCDERDICASEGSSKSITEAVKKDPEEGEEEEEEEEEPLYEILDSVEEDQEDSASTQVSGEITKTHIDQEASVENLETSDGGLIVDGASKALVVPEVSPSVVADRLETVDEDSSYALDCGTGKKKNPPRPANTKEQNLTPREGKPELPEENTSCPLNLERISEDEDFPPDAPEKEVGPQLKREGKTGTKHKEANGKNIGRGIRRRTRRRTEEKQEEEQMEEEEEEEELVILDEEEEQTLVTLDEFVEEEDDTKLTQTQPLCQQVEAADVSSPVTWATEAEGDDQEKVAKEETTTKRKCSDDTEEAMSFVTVDEVGEEKVPHRTRGCPPKRRKQTAVRKSLRGKKAHTSNKGQEEQEAGDEPPASPLRPSSLSSAQDVDVNAQVLANAAPGGQEVQENQLVDSCSEEEEKEGFKRANVKAENKERREPAGPEAKRPRSESPCEPADFVLPPFQPNNPLGQEFVVPTSGYFCSLCSIFYLKESMAKERHCSSRRHYESLQKYYQKCKQTPRKPSATSSDRAEPSTEVKCSPQI